MKFYKNFSLLIIIALFSYQASAQTNISLDNFSGIDFRAAGNVFLKKGNENSISIKNMKNITAEDFDIEVKKGKLIIQKQNKKDGSADFYITYTSLNRVVFSGAGNLESQNTIKNNTFEIVFSGAGNMDLDLKVDELEAILSGAGNMNLRGNATSAKLIMSGAGNLEAEDLVCQEATSILNGMGNLKVNASKSLEAIVSGIGDIYYKGNPTSTHFKTTGQGKIKKM